jgi:putative radical SAM enzyme (TIGR03279 family)
MTMLPMVGETNRPPSLGPARHPDDPGFGAIAPREQGPSIDALGGVVSSVRPGGPADRAGLCVGDRLVAIDGVVPRDLTDVRYQIEGADDATLDVLRDGRVITLPADLNGDLDLGVDFEQPAFDGLRQCNNNCDFCFIRGLPKGLRRSLYVRDDDYRYSFLFGSFVTLTNLADEDWHRIAYQRLTPLRVSIHATDPLIRARLLAHPGAAPILPQLAWLGRAGIQVHAQVVLCPDINDGPVLEQTVRDLAGLGDVVQSIAVVPVGISDHLRPREIRAVTPADAEAALRLLGRLRRECRQMLGRRLVFPADELFLLAGRPLPGSSYYEGFPQLQNGVGLVRVMLNDWRQARRSLPSSVGSPRRVVWLCGRAAAPALRAMASDASTVDGLTVEVREVENTVFGSAITVSGLMTGRDAARTLHDVEADRAVLPRSAFGYEGARTIDDWSVPDLEAETGLAIRLGRTATDLVRATTDGPLAARTAHNADNGRDARFADGERLSSSHCYV